MKIIAVIQFYLPYVLPRGPDWEDKGVAISFPDLFVQVQPRNCQEELFPYEIDRTLSTMEFRMQRISLPVSATARIVRDLCYDRLQTLVEGEVDWESASPEEVEERFKRAAIKAANVFLNHVRVATEALFVAGVEEEYRIQDGRRYVITPHTISWFDGATGKRFLFYQGEGDACATSGAIRSPERGSVSMAEIYASLNADSDPDLPKSLLLDAEERIITMRLREGILALGTACEVASNQYLIRHGREQDPQIKKVLRGSESFAAKRLH